jgi:hypothetical protein
LQTDTSDCSEIAALTAALIKLQGINADHLSAMFDYSTRMGPAYAGHDIVYAAGMWVDAQINVAFAVDLSAIAAVPPEQRLSTLLDAGQVYGFYNWYLKPEVRQNQLDHGLDGGILAFYYYWYFAGIGQGNSTVTKIG